MAADRESHSTCAPVSAVHDGCALGRCTCIYTPAVMATDGDVTGHDQDSGKAESNVSDGEAHSMCVLSSATLDGGAPAVVTLDGVPAAVAHDGYGCAVGTCIPAVVALDGSALSICLLAAMLHPLPLSPRHVPCLTPHLTLVHREQLPSLMMLQWLCVVGQV